MYQFKHDRKEEEEKTSYVIGEEASTGESYDTSFESTEEDQQKSEQPASSDVAPQNNLPLSETIELIEHIKYKSFPGELKNEQMEYFAEQAYEQVKSGKPLNDDVIEKLFEYSTELPENFSTMAHEAVLNHYEGCLKADTDITAEDILDLYEIQAYAKGVDAPEMLVQSESIIDSVVFESSSTTPLEEVDTTEIEDLTISEARDGLEDHLEPFRPISDEHRELVEQSALEYVSDLRGHILPKEQN